MIDVPMDLLLAPEVAAQAGCDAAGAARAAGVDIPAGLEDVFGASPGDGQPSFQKDDEKIGTRVGSGVARDGIRVEDFTGAGFAQQGSDPRCHASLRHGPATTNWRVIFPGSFSLVRRDERCETAPPPLSPPDNGSLWRQGLPMIPRHPSERNLP